MDAKLLTNRPSKFMVFLFKKRVSKSLEAEFGH